MSTHCSPPLKTIKGLKAFSIACVLWLVCVAAEYVHIRWLQLILDFLSAVCNQNNLSVPLPTRLSSPSLSPHSSLLFLSLISVPHALSDYSSLNIFQTENVSISYIQLSSSCISHRSAHSENQLLECHCSTVLRFVSISFASL